VATPDSPWHRPIPRPSIGDGPSIGGSRPPAPQNSGLRPPMPGSPPSTGGGNRPPIPPNSGNGRRSRADGGFRRDRILQILAVSAGLVFLAGFVAVMMNRGDAGESLSSESDQTISPTTPKNATQNTENTFAPVGDNWENVARSVVYIEATGSACGWRGSGSIVGDGSLVLTNQHVAGDGECDLAVYLTDSTSATPTQSVRAEVVVSDSAVDLAIIQLLDSSGASYVAPGRTPLSLSAAVPKLGDKITILGYPGLGGSTITLTSGDFSGIDRSESYEYLKTTANMNPGVSGGSAFNSAKQLVGVPTAGRGAEIACDGNTDCVANGSTIGLLRPVSLAQQILTRANSKLGK